MHRGLTPAALLNKINQTYFKISTENTKKCLRAPKPRSAQKRPRLLANWKNPRPPPLGAPAGVAATLPLETTGLKRTDLERSDLERTDPGRSEELEMKDHLRGERGKVRGASQRSESRRRRNLGDLVSRIDDISGAVGEGRVRFPSQMVDEAKRAS